MPLPLGENSTRGILTPCTSFKDISLSEKYLFFFFVFFSVLTSRDISDNGNEEGPCCYERCSNCEILENFPFLFSVTAEPS